MAVGAALVGFVPNGLDGYPKPGVWTMEIVFWAVMPAVAAFAAARVNQAAPLVQAGGIASIAWFVTLLFGFVVVFGLVGK